MNRRLRPSKRSDESFLRFLKPGALAQLRNSRISARSHRTDAQTQISLCRTPSPSPSPARSPNRQIDGVPNFAGRIYGVRCPQRKKLVAAKALYFLSSNPSSPGSDSANPGMDVFSLRKRRLDALIRDIESGQKTKHLGNKDGGMVILGGAGAAIAVTAAKKPVESSSGCGGGGGGSDGGGGGCGGGGCGGCGG